MLKLRWAGLPAPTSCAKATEVKRLRRASLPTPEGFEQAGKAQSKAVISDLIFKSSVLIGGMLRNEMDDSVFETLRGINRKHFHEIWKKAQNGELQGLNEEEQRLGKIMLDHSEEYFNQFEFADAMADHEYNPESEVNPFLHVTLHAIAEKQIQDRNPIEAFQFYNAMLRKKCSRHEAIHLLNIILIKFIFQTLKEKVPFPLDNYRKILKEYKSRKPEKIYQLLENIQIDSSGVRS